MEMRSATNNYKSLNRRHKAFEEIRSFCFLFQRTFDVEFYNGRIFPRTLVIANLL